MTQNAKVKRVCLDNLIQDFTLWQKVREKISISVCFRSLIMSNFFKFIFICTFMIFPCPSFFIVQLSVLCESTHSITLKTWELKRKSRRDWNKTIMLESRLLDLVFYKTEWQNLALLHFGTESERCSSREQLFANGNSLGYKETAIKWRGWENCNAR